MAGRLELCYRPFSMAEELAARRAEPAATLLILPDGRVKAAAPSDYVCADLSHQTFLEAWNAYRRAWSDPRLLKDLDALPAMV